MVIPVAFAVAAGAAVVKAKCAWMLGSKDVAKGNCPDPWAMKVDLTSTEDKRKAAQQRFESSEENVSKEKEKMRAQAEILKRLEAERKAEVDSDDDQEDPRGRLVPAAPPPQARPSSSGPPPIPKASQRPLLCGPVGYADAESSTQKLYYHQGLHSTGTVFVTPVDSSNAREFFAGRMPFKAVLVTELPETPAWYRQFASEHRAVCAFGETRCTDQLMMDLFGVSAVEPLPVCIVASDAHDAVRYWRSKGLDLFSLGLVADSPQAFCSGHMDPTALCALMRQALAVPPQRDDRAGAAAAGRAGGAGGGGGVGTWCSQAP